LYNLLRRVLPPPLLFTVILHFYLTLHSTVLPTIYFKL